MNFLEDCTSVKIITGGTSLYSFRIETNYKGNKLTYVFDMDLGTIKLIISLYDIQGKCTLTGMEYNDFIAKFDELPGEYILRGGQFILNSELKYNTESALRIYKLKFGNEVLIVRMTNDEVLGWVIKDVDVKDLDKGSIVPTTKEFN